MSNPGGETSLSVVFRTISTGVVRKDFAFSPAAAFYDAAKLSRHDDSSPSSPSSSIRRAGNHSCKRLRRARQSTVEHEHVAFSLSTMKMGDKPQQPRCTSTMIMGSCMVIPL
jgi:hypothetical protein